MLALVYHLHGAVHDGGTVADGSRGDNLYGTVADVRYGGEVVRTVEQLTAGVAPVGEKGMLQLG